MKELELLGLDATGTKLTFNDADGNRYTVDINEDLRTQVRKSVAHSLTPQNIAPAMLSARELQAAIRAGTPLSKLTERTNLPVEQIQKLAYPIYSERNYNANQAQQFVLNGDNEGITLAEIVVARLVERGVKSEEISWDAIKDGDSPWILIASYEIAGEEFNAKWSVNTSSRSVRAINDEAAWFTENPISVHQTPWRPLNTPPVTELNQKTDHNAPTHFATSSLENTLETVAQEGNSVTDNSPVSTPPASAILEEEHSSPTLDIDAVLASLDSQRGIAKPMPILEEEFFGAHPAPSEPEIASDTQILGLPPVRTLQPKNNIVPDSSASLNDTETLLASDTPAGSTSSESTSPLTENPVLTNSEKTTDTTNSNSASAVLEQPDTLPGLETTPSPKTTRKNKTKRERPAMPSWDEIVFGYSAKDD